MAGAAQTSLGRVSVLHKGQYDPTQAYKRLDEVQQNGSSYRATEDIPAGISPESGDSRWVLVSARGEVARVRVHIVNVKADLLALSDANVGDNGYLKNPEQGESSIWILSALPASDEDNWLPMRQLGVQSVNGNIGPSVELTTSDIDEGTNLYWTDDRFSTEFSNAIANISVSDLSGGDNIITEETDPTVPAWAKKPDPPTAADIGLGNIDDTSDEDKPVSRATQEALDRKADAEHTHSEYVTEETDPTVPAWAKAASKPTYTAAEVGAAASGHGHIEYLTEETDPTVPAWAKAANKPAYTAAEVGAAEPAVTQSLTLTVSGWSGAVQTLASGAITSATQPGDLFISQSATAEQFAAWAATQPQVTGQAVGSITVTARGDVPAIDIPVTLEVRS